MTTRSEIVRAARSWIGTPFHHQASLRSVGADCVGFVRGVVVSELKLLNDVTVDVQQLIGYSRQPDGKLLKSTLDSVLTPKRFEEVKPGDILLFAITNAPQHVGIVGDYAHGGLSLIHARQRHDGKGAVTETRLMFARNLKLIAAYEVPGVEDG